jgi:nucleotide-binding universal stress UspA family protein
MGLTYMQRRASGIYEFRQHLPQKLAGKPVPVHMRPHVPELINTKTGNFKRELTKSLQTTDYRAARKRDLLEASRVEELFSFALELVAGNIPSKLEGSLPSLTEIENDAIRDVLEADEEDRRNGDARKQLQTVAERAQWPDIEPIRFGVKGMEHVHMIAMEEEIDLLLGDFQKAYSRRDPSISR